MSIRKSQITKAQKLLLSLHFNTLFRIKRIAYAIYKTNILILHFRIVIRKKQAINSRVVPRN